jgi:DNA-binding transcriptional ArsR family regulator
MRDFAAIAEFSQALADETRLRLLDLLQSGDATVSELAVHLGLPQPRISTHLAILLKAGLVSVEANGRHRSYSVDTARTAPLLNALDAVTSSEPTRTPKRVPRLEVDSTPIRRARTCYDHLAGIAGVALLDELLKRNWLSVAGKSTTKPQYGVTAAGVHALVARGVDLGGVQTSRRMFAYGCLDWSERRPHLAGSLGAALLAALVDANIVELAEDSRAAILVRPLSDWFDALTPTQ